MNPPYDKAELFLKHYFNLKQADPTLSGIFVLPVFTDTTCEDIMKQHNCQMVWYHKPYRKLFTQLSDEHGNRQALPPCPFAVRVYYDTPAESAVVNSVKTDRCKFSFAATVQTIHDFTICSPFKVNMLVDTGANAAVLISKRFVDSNQLKYTELDDPMQYEVATGEVVTVSGSVKLKLTVGAYSAVVDAQVFDLGDQYELLVGDRWLDSVGAVIDYPNSVVNLSKHRIRLSAIPVKCAYRSAFKQLSLISVKEVKRMLRKRKPMFMVKLSSQDDEAKDQSVNKMADSIMQKLLKEYEDVFKDEVPELPPDRDLPHIIDLERPFTKFRPMPRFSRLELEEIRKQLESLLKLNLIELSHAPYTNQLLFVPKPDGSWRMCIDFRQLNACTRLNKYPLPRIDTMLDHLRGAKLFSSIDLTSGYWQIKLREEDKPLTSFQTPYGLYQFKVMPFGLVNAPATFQALMNSIFSPYLYRFIMVYLDDILVFSRTPEEHEQHLRVVFETLRKHKLYAKSSKCKFNLTELKFLGHIISDKGIQVDPKKTLVVKEWPKPSDATQLRSFLGLSNYFRKFIYNYAGICIPLYKNCQKDKPFVWTAECDKAFQKLKDALTAPPILTIPDINKPFELICDASMVRIAAILMQDGKVVAYESRKLKGG